MKSITPWVIVAAVLLMVASIASMHLLIRADRAVVRTFAVSNANRHVGLALLLSGRYLHNRDALPVVACYALVVAVLLTLSPKLFRPRDLTTKRATA